MERDDVLEALAVEGARAAEAMFGITESDFDRPTRCRPWSVRALLAHLLVASNRLPVMLAETPPSEAQVSAAGYYRADRRFGSNATEARVAAATGDAASFVTGHALVQAFDSSCKEMWALAAGEPGNRLVRTRWGDTMSLTDFLVTRVVELGVHGLDLSEGLGRRPWLTPPAASVIERLLVGDAATASVPGLGWDQLTLIESATGRRPVSDADAAILKSHGVGWLTFG